MYYSKENYRIYRYPYVGCISMKKNDKTGD